jgi:nitroimidazol reductase NimA-like FMN-containing flavoprotein (pyridoxamine 5'-phosphate oxidase superfamily)
MATIIPENYADLFQKKALAHLATLMPDGSPQVTPVWVEYDGTHILINSARGRQKDRNLRGNPQVSLSICDPDNPYRYLEVRGRVVAKKYLGVDSYPYSGPGEVRVTYRIQPTHTTQMG